MPRIPHIRRPQRQQATSVQPQPAAARFSLFPEMETPSRRRRERAPAPPPISQEEESDWLGNTMGAVQYVGETLDKGGAAVRGMMGGQGADALLNLIPFSDTLGITDPKERIYGEDLLEQWGVVGPKSKEGIDWGRTLGGLGVDILTDPLTLVGGPLSKAATSTAKAAKLARAAGKAVDAVPLLKEVPGLLKAGKLADVASHTPTTLSAALRTGEAPVATLHAPFWAEWLGASKEPWMEFGAKSGKVGQAAAKTAATANDILAYHTPIKYLRGLLSPAATGSLSKQGSRSTSDTAQQILNDLNYSTRKQLAGAADNLVVSAGKASADLQKRFGELAEHFKESGDIHSYQEFTKRIVTDRGGIPDPAALHQQLLKTFRIPASTTPEAMGQTSELAKRMYESFTPLREAMDYQHNLLRELGHPTKNLQDIYASYWPRGSSEARTEETMNRLLNLRDGLPEGTIRSDIARKDYFRNVPGADSTIDALAKNPVFSGFEVAEDGIYRPLSKAEHIEALQTSLELPNVDDLDHLRTEYLRNHIAPKLEAAWPDKNEVRKLIDAKGEEVAFTHADELVAWMDDDTRAKNLIDALDDMSPKTRSAAIKSKMAGSSKVTRGKLQKEIDAIGGGIWENGVFDGDPIDDAMRNMRYMLDQEATMRATHNFMAQPGVVRSAADLPDGAALRTIWKDVGFEEVGLRKFVLDNADGFGYDARALMADPEAMKAAIDNLHLTPGAEGALLSYNQMTQPRVQGEFIGIFDRVSSVYKSLLYNIWPASHIRDSISDLWQAASMGYAPLWGGKNGGILNGMGKAAAYIQKGIDLDYLDEYKALGMGLSADMIDALRSFSAAKALAKMPEPGSGLLKGVFGEGWKAGKKNPFRMPGFMTTEKIAEGVPMNKAMEIANRVQNAKHFISQYGYYDALRKRGFSPGQAKNLIEKTFFTANEQSKFARDIASRGVLFWRFASHNIPFQLRKLAEQPGGIAAQTFRGITELSAQQNPDVYTPRFLQETQTMPVGATDPNAQSFFRNSVFPINDFNDIVMRGNMPDIKRTAMKALARLHPLALAGPEMLSNTQFATGRKISDLRSPTKSLLGTQLSEIDRILHYLPTSRAQSEAWSVLDPRKSGWQRLSNVAGTGSVSTYDTEKWKNLDYREALAKDLKESPDVSQWTSYYVPKSRQEDMSPDEVEKTKMLIKRRNQITKRLQRMRKTAKQSNKK